MGDDERRNNCCDDTTRSDLESVIVTADSNSHTLDHQANLFLENYSVQYCSPSIFCQHWRTASSAEFSSAACASPTILGLSQEQKPRLRRLHQPIVPISPFDASKAGKNIRRKIIDGSNVKRRNTSVSVIQRRRKNWRRCHLGPSFFFAPFSADSAHSIEMPSLEADNGPSAFVNGHRIKRKRKTNSPDNHVSSHPASVIASRSATRPWNMLAGGRPSVRNSGRKAFLVHLLTLLFCFYCLPIFSPVGCTAASVQGTPAPSTSGDGLISNYGDKRNLESGVGDRQLRFRKVYTNQWAVEIVDGSDEIAEQIARRHGFTYLGRVVGDYYLFVSERMRRKRSTRRARYLQYELGREPQVRVIFDILDYCMRFPCQFRIKLLVSTGF